MSNLLFLFCFTLKCINQTCILLISFTQHQLSLMFTNQEWVITKNSSLCSKSLQVTIGCCEVLKRNWKQFSQLILAESQTKSISLLLCQRNLQRQSQDTFGIGERWACSCTLPALGLKLRDHSQFGQSWTVREFAFQTLKLVVTFLVLREITHQHLLN